MKVACLQFAPKVGEYAHNIARAEEVLAHADIERLHMLVLPELAFTVFVENMHRQLIDLHAVSGYNFPSLAAIQPFLEVRGRGRSSTWAKDTARRLNCIVTVGYPEKEFSNTPFDDSPKSHNFNSTITYSPTGTILAHYRKNFLYYTDETWASEGEDCQTSDVTGLFFAADIGEPLHAKLAMGICMDINPYKFIAPWDAYEFANHVLDSGAELVVLSMAWLSHSLTKEEINGDRRTEPELETLSYWVERFRPVVAGERQVIVVIGNRCGIEGGDVCNTSTGAGDMPETAEVCYAGSSTVIRIGKGKVELWDVLGKGEERCLLVDTEEAPRYVLQTGPGQQGENTNTM